jgi:hypothetical protein
MLAHFAAKLCVKGFRIAASQLGHIANPQQIEIGGNRRPDSGNARQVGNHRLGSGVAPGLPSGIFDAGRRAVAFRVRALESSGLSHVFEHTAALPAAVAVFSNRPRRLPVKICA